MEFKYSVQSDIPDSRDWIYQPRLNVLPEEKLPPEQLNILDQGSEGACTGFAVAAAINILKRQEFEQRRNNNNKDAQSEKLFIASTSMLYQMARRHDEWAGINYEGSSLRGAIQGWRHMGVCSEDLWPSNLAKKDNFLTIPRFRQARENALGAYYRVLPSISDYQAALNETGVLVCSAQVHQGWDHARYGKIKPSKKILGSHAFTIVGYNNEGFFVQNSWGESWGKKGIALWSYQDWQQHVIDAWVFRLAPTVPDIFGKRYISSVATGSQSSRSATRSEIAGHFVNLDEGEYLSCGKYWSDDRDIQQTADVFARSRSSQEKNPSTGKAYDHIVFVAHSGLHPTSHAANRIVTLKNLFRENHIYPVHFMHDSGFEEEFTEIIDNKLDKAKHRAGNNSEAVDRVFEHFIKRPGKILWKDIKDDMLQAFKNNGAGKRTVNHFLSALKKSGKKKKIHLIGHGAGCIFIANLLSAFSRHKLTIESCHLFAPALSIADFKKSMVPILRNQKSIKLKSLDIYNLDDTLENNDTVGSNAKYGGSLLYLVSNVLEKNEYEPLLGLEEFVKDKKFQNEVVKKLGAKIKFHWSKGYTGKSRSLTHDGFFTDLTTIKHVINVITKGKVKRKIRAADLSY